MLYMFLAVSPSIIRSSRTVHIPNVVFTVLELLMMGGETASGSSKQAWHIPDAVCTVLELLMMDGETARNMYSIDNNKEYCITLHLFGCT